MAGKIWIGAARPLGLGALEAGAARLGCDPAALRAVVSVEASGRWYRRDGTLARRFEPHHLPPAMRADLGFSGGWRAALALGAGQRAAMFSRAYAADPEAAAMASSWGGPQMMGFNAGACGYPSAVAMVEAMADDAGAQLGGMVKFIEARGAGGALRGRDWVAFARLYNGTGQPETYAGKMAAAWEAAKLDGAAVSFGADPAPEVLREGSRGASVIEAQRALGIKADGIFGAETTRAVRWFQDARGLPTDGVIGARTWAALRQAVRKVDRADPGTRARGEAEGARVGKIPPGAPIPRPRLQSDRVEVAARVVRDLSGVAGGASAALRGVGEAVGDLPPALLWTLGGGAAVALAACGIAAAVALSRRMLRRSPAAGP
jgi:hypothetical protein